MSPLRVGTRGSALALAQARGVAERVGGEIVAITTAGDVDRASGDKSRWTGALERALLDAEIDLAVHSAKDVPGELGEGTALVAAPPRADPRDVLVGAGGLEALPDGARVGTSSLRRRAQLLAARADLEVVELRGNVDTRLRKLAAGEADALVLAAAGLERLGLAGGAAPPGGPLAAGAAPPGGPLAAGAAPPGGPVVAGAAPPTVPLDPDRFVPAPGQGILAIQARAGDARAAAAAAAVNDAGAWAALAAERSVVAALGASCHTPVGALARPAGGSLRLVAFAGLPDGSEWVRDELDGSDPERLGRAVAERMLAAGAGDLLARAEALA